MQFGDYMEYLTPEKREFNPKRKGREGMNAIAVQKTEGKDLLDYPVVKKYVDMFNFKSPIAPRDVDLLHYDPVVENEIFTYWVLVLCGVV